MTSTAGFLLGCGAGLRRSSRQLHRGAIRIGKEDWFGFPRPGPVDHREPATPPADRGLCPRAREGFLAPPGDRPVGEYQHLFAPLHRASVLRTTRRIVHQLVDAESQATLARVDTPNGSPTNAVVGGPGADLAARHPNTAHYVRGPCTRLAKASGRLAPPPLACLDHGLRP